MRSIAKPIGLALVLAFTLGHTAALGTPSSPASTPTPVPWPFGLSNVFIEPLYVDPFESAPMPRLTAVYDISARVVVLPDGTRLEAHSGLGDRVDNPRFVHLRMRGSTPPAVYELAYLKSLFRGVMALSLNPVSGNVFGRTALLAHTYMLRGRSGESNGCVVFRDYGPFLRAFREGRIRWLRVVPGVGDASLRVAQFR